MLSALQLVTVLIASMICAPVSQKSKGPNSGQDSPCPSEISGDLSQFDLAQCWEREHKKTDVHLNALYSKLVDFMVKDIAADRRKNDTEILKVDEVSLQDLKRTEGLWLRYRDSQCEAAQQQYEGGSAAPMIWHMCMVRVTNHRIGELKSVYEMPNRKLE